MSANGFFIKHDVSEHEYLMHKLVYKYVQELKKTERVNMRVPRVEGYNKTTKTMRMRRVYGDNISNIYGENYEDVPSTVTTAIRSFIQLLHTKYIDYPDITGYNFMLDKGENIYIVDFGHATARDPHGKGDSFVWEFVNGAQSWNPDFR